MKSSIVEILGLALVVAGFLLTAPALVLSLAGALLIAYGYKSGGGE
jgi:hypothetical protein